MADYIGQIINNYRLTKFLGEGSFAEVYLGEQVEHQELSAIKILHTRIKDSKKRESFLKEAHLIAELRHPHIIHLLDIGFIDNIPFIIMSYAKKGTLRQKHPEESLLKEEIIIQYTQQLAAALQYAHNKNIIHCDVTPENILLDDENHLILSDFGIARIVQSTRLQTTHGPEGTPTYMAPEQFRGKPSKKSDQYSLGIMVYEWICGELPFKGETFLQLMDMHEKVKPPSLHTKVPGISPKVVAVVQKALEKDPKKRFDNIQDFANALEEAFHASNVLGRATSNIFRRIIPVKMHNILSNLQRLQIPSVAKLSKEEEIQSFDKDMQQPQLYTALDIGTAYAKAIIIEAFDDVGIVLGVGRSQQSYTHMLDGMVVDIPAVIANCNEALLEAERSAGNIIAPLAVVGIAGELVKGSSTTLSIMRQDPTKPISIEELEGLISRAQQKSYKKAKELIATESGYPNIEIRLTNSYLASIRIDGQKVFNPIGFMGRELELTLFCSFAPLMQLGALETVAKGLDLTLLTIACEPYALGRCLSTQGYQGREAIFIDIGGGTTDIALVRQGGVEDTRMFAMGGRKFTKRLASHKDISLKDAEEIKILYSSGNIKGAERNEIHSIFASEAQTWMSGIELLLGDLAKEETLPTTIYLVGGGSSLPDLREQLENFTWEKRLPFSRKPNIETVQPSMVPVISDPHKFLKDAQDITPMALAYQAIELQGQDDSVTQAISRVIHRMNL